MRLYVETMDAVLVDFDGDGLVRFENEEWRRPTLQERRAVTARRASGVGRGERADGRARSTRRAGLMPRAVTASRLENDLGGRHAWT